MCPPWSFISPAHPKPAQDRLSTPVGQSPFPLAMVMICDENMSSLGSDGLGAIDLCKDLFPKDFLGWAQGVQPSLEQREAVCKRRNEIDVMGYQKDRQVEVPV